MPKEEHRMDSITDGVLFRVVCPDCDEEYLLYDPAMMYPADFVANMDTAGHNREEGHNAFWEAKE